MRIVQTREEQGAVVIKIEHADDLWYLSQIIAPGDAVQSKTARKVKAGEQEDSVKKHITLQVKVERVVFQGDVLRVMGKVTKGTEDVPSNVHHTLSITPGTQLEIMKERWDTYQKKRLKEAEQQQEKVLMIAFDREQALFGVLQQRGYSIIRKLAGVTTSKRQPKNEQENFYKDIIDALKQEVERMQPQHIVIGSPAFWKDELMKELKDDALKKIIITTTCSSVSNNAFAEMLKKAETSRVLQQAQLQKETTIVETLLAEIAKQGLATYGYKQIEKCVESGAVAILLVSTALIKHYREKNAFDSLESLMKQTEAAGGKVSIISAEHEAGSQLEGLGGLGALLRYK